MKINESNVLERNVFMRKKFSPSYMVALSIYGFSVLSLPLIIFFILTNVKQPFSVLPAAMISGGFGAIIVLAGGWLLMRPLKRILSMAHTALNGFQGGVVDVHSSFSIHELETSVHAIGKMAVLGHETIKAFRALPVPALLFDRNGMIISLSSGLRIALNNELKGLSAPNGSTAFTGEHISALFGELRVDHMFRNQHTPVIIKENSDLKITASLSQLNENISRKEAGLILLNVEHKNGKAVSFKLSHNDEVISELKSAYFTITNSFSEIAEFMHGIAKGKFSARIALEAKGDLGRLVHEANAFASHLEQLSGLLTPRIASAQRDIEQVHAENDEIISTAQNMQRSLSLAFNHFSASTLTDKNIAELFHGLHEATHLMESEARNTHLAVVDAVNTHNKAMKLLETMADFSTNLEDMGFHLKLLGLNAAVEAARVEQGGAGGNLNELCKDIRELGTRFREAAGDFRECIMPVHDQSSMAQHMLAAAQNAIMHIAPAAIQVQNQLRTQEGIVRAALKPRIEAAQALEQAIVHSKSVHHTILATAMRVGTIAADLTELHELTTAVIPAQSAIAKPIERKIIDMQPQTQPQANDEPALENDLSLDWFRRDILLRELSGDLDSTPGIVPAKGEKKSSSAA